ncbi:hypothetical protein Taro_014779 [Colocasia esculenta]|uniref:Aminotransferase-like plant mobile domain-containing protein n=1 Tax=Colocasia esculenta TaxID=4460 RepID=A0A843UFI6_COLES|nr:hypothetical protein [Colocasia esculenta]
MIPSLEDVSRITGFRVYGRAVSGYTYPCYHDIAERLLDLPVERRSSLVPMVALQKSLGLYEAGKNAGESEDEYLARLARVSQRELASEPGPHANMDLRRFLVLFPGRLLFATRGDTVHCRFLPLLEDLGEVGGYAWGVAFLAHQFDGLSASERPTSTSGFYPFLQLERLQEAIDSYPYLDVVWQPYLGEGDEGQPWLVHARPYFGRSVWLHALNLVLPLNLFLTQRSLGLRQSVDVTGEIASLRALLQSAVQRSELERVRGTGAGGASSSRSTGGSPSLIEARLTGAVLRAEEAQRHLEERSERDRFRGEVQTTRSERDQPRIRAEAAEAQVAEMARELAMLRVKRLPGD